MPLILLLLLLTGCAFFEPRDKDPKDESVLPAALVEQAKLYCELSEPAYRERGYVHSRCDGAGFTSLYSIACRDFGTVVDLSVFEDSSGRPYRDPLHQCYSPDDDDPSNDGSAAGYSRDMLLMRLAAAFESRDLPWFERFDAFATSKNWIICDAKDDVTRISRCAVTPALIRLFYDAMSKVRGYSPGQLVDDDSMDASAVPRDFEAHLQVLKIWLSGEVYGAITASELAVAEAQAKREPSNALFQAVFHRYSDGDQQTAYKLLTERFPAESLPTTKMWCSEYLYQRDQFEPDGSENTDWLPCPDSPESVHSGTDFGLVVHILGKS